jgi:hypothetical protein
MHYLERTFDRCFLPIFQFIWLMGFRFQRRRLKCEKLTDDGRQVMAKISHCLWQAELIKIFRFDFETVWKCLYYREIRKLPNGSFNYQLKLGPSLSWSIVVGFTTTYAISVYPHSRCEFKSRSWWSVLNSILCDKVCQWLAAGWWFFAGTPVSSINKTDSHDINEILLKVALNTIYTP